MKKRLNVDERRGKSLLTQSAGPFWILQCYENLDMLCTEFFAGVKCAPPMKTGKRARLDTFEYMIYIPIASWLCEEQQ